MASWMEGVGMAAVKEIRETQEEGRSLSLGAFKESPTSQSGHRKRW